jgi:hypothetical protein
MEVQEKPEIQRRDGTEYQKVILTVPGAEIALSVYLQCRTGLWE